MFRPDWHDAEPKIILGTKLPAGGGVEEGHRVLDTLAAHPSTAAFIAAKLCRKFVADDPPAGLVDRVAGVFLRTKGNLRATTAAVLRSEEFLDPRHRGVKVKSPLEFLASAARALEVRVSVDGRLGRSLRALGAPLYGAAAPTGYPDTAPEWTSANAILARMEVGAALASAALGPERGRETRNPSTSVVRRTDALLERLLPGGASGATRERIGSDWRNPFTDHVAVVVVDSGPEHTGRFVERQRNVREDFRRLFGHDVESIDAIAIMTDTDNSGLAATGYYGPIRFASQPPVATQR